ncbi:carbohydrate ABC transporter permease [Microlunatus flavus]|uniref:Multiple sugar transport system permease protein n=1 Tax=Microlunatus flavus TaxID=1036181 RepID=A0A1H9A9L6_9ACTN|nr:sugar ABC transporter permease [Microlunatus flavus]SEP73349.1 multiple sugar transport system permease protein [Microlunatus flavus]
MTTQARSGQPYTARSRRAAGVPGGADGSAATTGGGSPLRKPRRFADNKVAYLFMAPWFVGLVVLTAGPLMGSLYLSFTRFNLLQPPRWVGLANYVSLLTDDPRFWQSLKVTLIYVALTVPLQLSFALGVAVLLNRRVRGIAWYRSVYYLPSLLGGSVAIAVVWSQLFGGDGVVNTLLGLVGIDGISWISNPSTALYTLVLLNIWQFGSPMVIFLAGLKQIPQDLYDAAAVDGASPWRRFTSVTLPMLTPIIFFNVVLQIIQAFQAFTPAYVISNGTGGPSDSTLFYTLYLYQQGFSNLSMGYASAMAWILLIIIGFFTLANFVLARRWVYYEDR